MRRTWVVLLGFLILGVTAVMLLRNSGPRPGQVQDEAMRAGRTAGSLGAAADKYFDGMDNGIELNEAETKGRNMWLVWTGGNDRFWDEAIKHAFGTFDLLK